MFGFNSPCLFHFSQLQATPQPSISLHILLISVPITYACLKEKIRTGKLHVPTIFVFLIFFVNVPCFGDFKESPVTFITKLFLFEMFSKAVFVIFSLIVTSVTLDVSLALIFRDKLFTGSIVASSKSEINTDSHANDELINLVKRIDTEQLPLFDFSKCMEELLNTEAYSFLQLENVYNKYLDALRDFYFHRFLRELGDISSSSILNEELFNSTKQRILKECKVAMTTAAPLHVRSRWDIEVRLLLNL